MLSFKPVVGQFVNKNLQIGVKTVDFVMMILFNKSLVPPMAI